MGDLYYACAIIAAVAIGLFVLTYYYVGCISPRGSNLLALGVVFALFLYINHLWYGVWLARVLPTSSVVVLANWLPLLAATLSAIVWRRSAGSRPRQFLYAGALCFTGGYALVHPLLGSPPQCGDRWDKLGNCLQTTKNTCSPACAATLLRAHGIEATEREMAQLCLTRKGTSWQGLYRGLKLKTADTRWDVEVRHCTADELRRLGHKPIILSVGLAAGTANEDLTQEFGWVPGVYHSVVLHGFNAQGNAIIADPTQEMCREHWDDQLLHALWRGHAFWLVERK